MQYVKWCKMAPPISLHLLSQSPRYSCWLPTNHVPHKIVKLSEPLLLKFTLAMEGNSRHTHTLKRVHKTCTLIEFLLITGIAPKWPTFPPPIKVLHSSNSTILHWNWKKTNITNGSQWNQMEYFSFSTYLQDLLKHEQKKNVTNCNKRENAESVSRTIAHLGVVKFIWGHLLTLICYHLGFKVSVFVAWFIVEYFLLKQGKI